MRSAVRRRPCARAALLAGAALTLLVPVYAGAVGEAKGEARETKKAAPVKPKTPPAKASSGAKPAMNGKATAPAQRATTAKPAAPTKSAGRAVNGAPKPPSSAVKAAAPGSGSGSPAPRPAIAVKADPAAKPAAVGATVPRRTDELTNQPVGQPPANGPDARPAADAVARPATGEPGSAPAMKMVPSSAPVPNVLLPGSVPITAQPVAVGANGSEDDDREVEEIRAAPPAPPVNEAPAEIRRAPEPPAQKPGKVNGGPMDWLRRAFDRESTEVTVSPTEPSAPPVPAGPRVYAPPGTQPQQPGIQPQPGVPGDFRFAPIRAPETAPLWKSVDAHLQRRLEERVAQINLGRPAQEKRLAVALVDATDPGNPRVAAINGDEMIYAASLPKIAILLGAFERIQEGSLQLDPWTSRLLSAMIRVSSNRAASIMLDRVGKDFIAQLLYSPRYQLYDPEHNGGIWVGKNFAQEGLWQRDPLHNLSHGGTAMQVARFYFLLETGQLVTPERSAQMKTYLSNPGIDSKFVKGMQRVDPDARLYRKSGTWQNWHSDSAIVERRGRSYIAVGLTDSPNGDEWLEALIIALDGIIMENPAPGGLAKKDE